METAKLDVLELHISNLSEASFQAQELSHAASYVGERQENYGKIVANFIQHEVKKLIDRFLPRFHK